jgi:hypothetical protein
MQFYTLSCANDKGLVILRIQAVALVLFTARGTSCNFTSPKLFKCYIRRTHKWNTAGSKTPRWFATICTGPVIENHPHWHQPDVRKSLEEKRRAKLSSNQTWAKRHMLELRFTLSNTFGILTAIKMSVLIFWVVNPCGLVGRYQRFG